MMETEVVRRRKYRKKRGEQRKNGIFLEYSSSSSEMETDEKMKHPKRGHSSNDLEVWIKKLYKRFSVAHLLCFVRLSSLVLCTSEFVPDEFWQSAEVAHFYVYGKGHLTWEWITGLRSYIYPLLHGILYYVVNYLGVDSSFIVANTPRVLQSIITAFGEFALFKYCSRRFGTQSARWILFLEITCWFTFYCSSRPITNSAEMALNCIAMYCLVSGYATGFVASVSVNFLIRPTAVIVWIPSVIQILRLVFKNRKTTGNCVFIGASVLALGIALDSWMLDKFVISWWNFLNFNVIQGESSQFGTHPALWYIYSALPSIFGVNLVFVLLALNRSRKKYKEEFFAIGFFILVFSVIGHKEIRFLLPIVPHMFCIIGDYSFRLIGEITSGDGYFKQFKETSRSKLKRLAYGIFFLSFVSNGLAAVYFTSFHQVGVKPATNFINSELESIENPTVWVLMPCYTIPVFTYMHHPNVQFEFLTCAPANVNLSMPNLVNEFSELDIEKFIVEKLKSSKVPDFIILFDHVTDVTLSTLQSLSLPYQLCASFFHSPFQQDNNSRIIDVICLV